MSYVKLKIKHLINLEEIANGDSSLNCPKTIVADYPLDGGPSLVFTKSDGDAGGCIVFMALELFA